MRKLRPPPPDTWVSPEWNLPSLCVVIFCSFLAGFKRRRVRAKPMNELFNQEYRHGFHVDLPTHQVKEPLSVDLIRKISHLRKEPEFLLDFRLKGLKAWESQKMPDFANLTETPIDFNEIAYFSSPINLKPQLQSLEDVPLEVRQTFDRLGIPMDEQKRLSNVAMDYVFDSQSVFTSFKEDLLKHGVIFSSISEAVHSHPELLAEYLGSVVPVHDNYFAALNSAVFSDGSFVYIPKNTKCPLDLSTYFRMNDAESGQFERTLIICDEGAEVTYLEGCTAPMFPSQQLHAAVVEVVARKGAKVHYSTVQNWYAGDKDGQGGVLNFVTKRAKGYQNSHVSWTQVETGSAKTWKYPSCVLVGEGATGEFHSIAMTNHRQEADTGTKMIHLAPNTSSKIISKSISGGSSRNTYRGLVEFGQRATNCRNSSQYVALLVGDSSLSASFPYIQCHGPTNTFEHEASTTWIFEN